MQRKKSTHPHAPPHRRLVGVLLLFVLVLAVAGGLFSCAFQPMLAARGTLLFLPGV